MSSLSLSPMAGRSVTVRGRLQPFLLHSIPPNSTTHCSVLSSTSNTFARRSHLTTPWVEKLGKHRMFVVNNWQNAIVKSKNEHSKHIWRHTEKYSSFVYSKWVNMPVASLIRGMGGDGHGSEAACHGSLVESGKIMHGFAWTRYYEVKPMYVIWNLLSMTDLPAMF